jgi:hypothetical protein
LLQGKNRAPPQHEMMLCYFYSGFPYAYGFKIL